MRLECLFQQVIQNAPGQSEWNSRMALQGLFEIFNLTSRAELKSELIKELERHAATLTRLRPMPGVDVERLDAILVEIGDTGNQLRDPNGLSLETIRQHGFLSTVRQRSSLPGGSCTFDLPALHHWLQQDSLSRTEDLESWLLPFEPMCGAVNLILQLIRSSALPEDEVAEQGFFQKALDNGSPNQMVRVMLPMGSEVFPEISGGRHRFAIRFMEQPDLTMRAKPCSEDIPFQLVCCVI